jgi:hypothetical protein
METPMVRRMREIQRVVPRGRRSSVIVKMAVVKI